MNYFIYALLILGVTSIALPVTNGLVFIARKNYKLNKQINKLEEFLEM